MIAAFNFTKWWHLRVLRHRAVPSYRGYFWHWECSCRKAAWL